MTDTERLIERIRERTGWRLDDLHILDERHMEWIAKATTTHLTKRGEPEISFVVIGEGQKYVTYELRTMPKLAAWCQQHHTGIKEAIDEKYVEFFMGCNECHRVAKWACTKTSAGIECICQHCDNQEIFGSWDAVMEDVVEVS